MIKHKDFRTPLVLVRSAAIFLMAGSVLALGCGEDEGNNEAQNQNQNQEAQNQNQNQNQNQTDPTANQEVEVCPGTVEVSSSITENETWSAQGDDCVDYVITNMLNVDATLTIEAGAYIVFNQGTGLRIREDGVVIADGDASNHIIMTGSEEEAGHWNGVWFENSSHPNNLLNYVLVEYGGGAEFHSSIPGANVVLGRSNRESAVSITNTILRHSEQYGLIVARDSRLREFEENTLTSNAAPAYLHPQILGSLDLTTSFQGNDTDEITVTSGTIGEEITISEVDVPFHTQSITVDAPLTITGGVQFLFDAETRFQVDQGPFIVAGEEGNEVIFSGSQQTPGWWHGIYIPETSHPNNAIDYLVVEYAGSDEAHHSVEPSGLVIGRSNRESSTTLTNSTFRHNASHGVWVHGASHLTSFEANTFENNDGTGISIPSSVARSIDANSHFEDNGINGIGVRGGSISTDSNWPNPGIPYFVTNHITIDDGDVTIEAGAEFFFDTGTYMMVDGGRLHISGEEGTPVVMEGLQQDPGWWAGIFFRETPSSGASMIDWLELRHAGDLADIRAQHAGITIGRSNRSALVEVNDSTIEDIGHHTESSYGIFVHNDSTSNADICSANTFNNVDGVDCLIDD